MNSPRDVATNGIVVNDKQIEKTKEKDFGISNEDKKDEKATENVEE